MGAEIVDMKSMSYSFGGGVPVSDISRMASDMGGGMMEYNQIIVPREVTTTVTVNATYEVVYVGD